MKAKWTNPRIVNRLLPVMAVILTFACTSCSENPPGIPTEDVLNPDGKIETEYFKVQSSGTIIHAFGGDVMLDFPPGTVPTTTRYKIVSFPLDHLDLKGRNVMLRAFSLKNIQNKNEFENPVALIIRYDLCEYNMCKPSEESELAIYRLRGDMYAYHKMEALGECSMNCSCKTVRTCIEECGSYVVVEK